MLHFRRTYGPALLVLAVLASLVGVVSAAPVGAEPTLTVEPSTGLVDRQSVTVTGSGFSADTTFGAAQCGLEQAQASQDITGCDLSTSVITSTDQNGDVSFAMGVRRYIQIAGDTLDCAEEGVCIIGAATIPDLINPVETGFVPITFDPDAPAIPPLEVDVELESINADGATGTVTCNRAAQAYVDVSLQQAKAGALIDRYGFSMTPCDVDPTPFDAPFMYGSGRLTGGSADYVLYGSAYDGFDSASAFVEGTTHVTGNSGPVMEPGSFPGETIEIIAVEGSATQGEPELVITVDCTEPRLLSADASVSQLAGLHSVSTYGFTQDVACDGETEVTLPLQASSGVVGGPASASVSVYAIDDSHYYYADYASWTGPVNLAGRANLPSPVVEPNPDSRIVIGDASTTTVSGTITCEEPVMVDVSVSINQRRGRTNTFGYGYDFIMCDGETPFEAMLYSENLRSGKADVFVYAYGYTIEPGPEYDEYIEQWSDQQAASVRLNR